MHITLHHGDCLRVAALFCSGLQYFHYTDPQCLKLVIAHDKKRNDEQHTGDGPFLPTPKPSTSGILTSIKNMRDRS